MEPWNVLLASHVIAALFVLAIGPVQILRRRRDRIHRTMGHLWVAAMYYVCFSSFWIVSDGHFSWLHGLSAFTIVTVTLGLISAVRRNIPAHRGNMIGSYIGIAVAFGFAVSVRGVRFRASWPRICRLPCTLPHWWRSASPSSSFRSGAVTVLGTIRIGGATAPLARGGAGHEAEAAAKMDR